MSHESMSGQRPRSEPLIIHVIDELPVGGAETHLVTMLREAVATYPIRHRVVSLFGDGPMGDQVRALGVPLDILDIRPHLGKRRFHAASNQLTAYFKQHRPDIVEAHLTWSRLLGLYAAWRAGTRRRIAFEHGELYLNSPKFRTAHFIAQHFAHRVIVVSEALRQWAENSYRLSPSRTVILYNCVDTDRFAPRTDMMQSRAISDSTRFVTTGTLGTGVDKRVDVLIRALASARRQGADVELLVCGDGPLRLNLERLAHSLGVDRNVQFLGMRNDIADILPTCDAFCLGTVFDPFPVAGLEALASGLPLIVPNSGGMVEAVNTGRTGVTYPALDHSRLAEQMIWFHGHPAERKRMGTEARRDATERFSVQSYVNRLYGIYGLDPSDAVNVAR